LEELSRSNEADPETLLKIYRTMVLTRAFDAKVLSLQRQGKVGAFITTSGEEACAVASSAVLEKDDWLFTSYRETGAHLLRGLSLDLLFAQIFGNSGDLLKGRQMSNSWGSKDLNIVPTAAPIGAYLPVAVGCAMAMKKMGRKTAVLAFLGDGGTSSSDFHTAMNFAGVFKAPIVFICRNNGWAISVPVSKQTASATLAVKASAYGFVGSRIDGNDALAIYSETSKALERAKSGGGPSFIEALTYRLGAHSTADDPARYRNEREETERWKGKDPIVRLKTIVISSNAWSEEQDLELRKESDRLVSEASKRQESIPLLNLEELLFDDVYLEPPRLLQEQKETIHERSDTGSKKMN
jgi:pyruvate dehydrogenase E1 component alpha subunit